MLQPVNRAPFLIDADKGGYVESVLEARGLFVNLIEAFNVALQQQDTAGADHVQNSLAFTVQRMTLITDEKELSDLFLECKTMEVFHGVVGSVWHGRQIMRQTRTKIKLRQHLLFFAASR